MASLWPPSSSRSVMVPLKVGHMWPSLGVLVEESAPPGCNDSELLFLSCRAREMTPLLFTVFFCKTFDFSLWFWVLSHMSCELWLSHAYRGVGLSITEGARAIMILVNHLAVKRVRLIYTDLVNYMNVWYWTAYPQVFCNAGWGECAAMMKYYNQPNRADTTAPLWSAK